MRSAAVAVAVVVAVAAASVLIGCGDPKARPPLVDGNPGIPDSPLAPAADIVEHGGTRLHLEWWQTAEGSKALRGLFDTVLDTECRFQPRPDGVSFDCLPSITATVGYADARCTQPITYWPATATPPRVAVELSLEPCNALDEHIAVYAPDARIAGTKIYRKTSSWGTCTDEAVPEGSLLSVKPADVVTATLTPIASSTNLIPTYFHASDGSVLAGQFIGSSTPAHCRLVATQTGFQCAPLLMLPILDAFSDASCTTHALGTLGADGCLVPALTLAPDGKYHVRGDPITTVYSADGQCRPTTAPRGAFAMAATYDLPSLGKQYGGSTRLQTIIATTEDGLREHLGYGFDDNPKTVFDSGLGIECAFQRTPDMTARCLPTERVVAAYSDAACTVPILAANVDTNFAVKRDPNDFFTVMEVYAVGSATTMYVKSGSECRPTTGYPTVGDPVPFDTFLLGTATTD